MISVKLKFRPSIIDGKEGSLYYQVICNRLVRRVSTSYKIYSYEWDFEKDTIFISQNSYRFQYLESVINETATDIKRLRAIEHNLLSHKSDIDADNLIAEFKKVKAEPTLFVLMETIASQYTRQGKVRTAETYLSTLSSFRQFRGNVDLLIKDMESDLLLDYENYLHQKHLAPNTISFYMKHLRSAYNKVVEEGVIADHRPFKHVLTSIAPTPKRALSLHNIKRIKELDLSNDPPKQFARDMFLFSFYTRGMSFVDIAFLRKNNIKGETLFYRRKKTNQLLEIHLEDRMLDIISKYQSPQSSPYVFNIVKYDIANHRKQYLNSATKINRHLKAIGRELALSSTLTMYCARHSWASIAREKGVPLAVISEGMGHNSEKTTQIYLASIKSEVIDKANREILNLL